MAKAKFNSNLGMSDIHVTPKLDLTGEIQGTQWANMIPTIHTMKQNKSLILQTTYQHCFISVRQELVSG